MKTKNEVINVTKDELKKRFTEYNRKYFNNELGKCDFSFLSPKDNFYGRFVSQKQKNGKLKSRIWISKNVKWKEESLQETLVHEMIHMYVRTVERKTWCGLFGHGRAFRKHCKRLYKDFGLRIYKHPYYNIEDKKKE